MLRRIFKIFTVVAVLILFGAFTANASLISFQTFTAEGAGFSVDAVGLADQAVGNVQAEIPVGAIIQGAYLYSASVWSFSSLSDVVFEGNTLTSDASSRLDVAARDGNVTSENRWDVTSIVQAKVGGGSGIFDFSVQELGYLDGEILAVLYYVPTDPVRTAFIFDGEMATTGDSFNINLSDSYDGTDAIMSLGISFGYQGYEQYTTVDVNGDRLTSSAGGEDDGIINQNGGLITAGGVGDSAANPVDPYAGPNGDPRYDDELYNLASFLTIGDNLVTISTLNPSNDDNVFFMAFQVNGEASVNGVPEPSTILLLGAGLLGLAGFRRKE